MKLVVVIGLFLTHICNAIGFLRYFIPTLKCKWPGEMENFDYDQLQGVKWYQTHATFGTDTYGCLWTQFRPDPDSFSDRNFYFDESWIQMNTRLLPTEKGGHAATYKLKGDREGKTNYHRWRIISNPDFMKIASTDYSSYILRYYCAQSWLDAATSEYFDILTPDGTISPLLYDQIMATVESIYPDYDISKFQAATTDQCPVS